MTKSIETPLPRPGEVIRYAYLWPHEQAQGHEESRKDRPCAVVLIVRSDKEDTVVYVVPITSRPPARVADIIELPPATCRRLRLQDERCWIVLTEVNRFIWPGPDLRPTGTPSGAFYSYGLLPTKLFTKLQNAITSRARQKKLKTITRSE
jgi:hypothetical protein